MPVTKTLPGGEVVGDVGPNRRRIAHPRGVKQHEQRHGHSSVTVIARAARRTNRFGLRS